MVLALTTSHKIGLLVFAGAFIAFAVLSAIVIPRFRPNFPGRGLPLFLIATAALFIATFTSVLIFGAESEEEEHGGSAVAQQHK